MSDCPFTTMAADDDGTKIEPPTIPWRPNPQTVFWFTVAEINRAAGNNETADRMVAMAKSYAGNH